MLLKLRTTLFFEERLVNSLDVHPSRAGACLPVALLGGGQALIPPPPALAAVRTWPAVPLAQQRVLPTAHLGLSPSLHPSPAF